MYVKWTVFLKSTTIYKGENNLQYIVEIYRTCGSKLELERGVG